MPLYEYRCSKCDKTFEVIQKFSDEPLSEHENCGGAVERLLSAPAFQLKGTGWYVTDYAKSGSKDSEPGSEKKSKESKTAESKDSASDAKSAETKPAASKPEAKTPASKSSD